MPAKLIIRNGRTASDIDNELPATFFLKRGHIQDAFGFTSEEMNALVMNGTFAAEYPVPGGKARFIRSKVMDVARQWEAKR